MGMFYCAESFNQPLGMWDVNHVTRMCDMFHKASSFNQPFAAWGARAVTNMSFMFNRASSFNQPLDTWDVSGDMVIRKGMLVGATSFQQ